MSLLASKDVSTRDAMMILGWESPEMIKVYERMLEAARGDADKRALELVNELSALKYVVPEPVTQEKLQPTETALRDLVAKYSNITVGHIYDISEAAVRKWLKKYEIKRIRRIESADIGDDEIQKIREALKNV
jgi:hypothetical protein